MTTHAVSDDEQSGACVPRVLIVTANESDIRPRGIPKAKGHALLLLQLEGCAPDSEWCPDGEQGG